MHESRLGKKVWCVRLATRSPFRVPPVWDGSENGCGSAVRCPLFDLACQKSPKWVWPERERMARVGPARINRLVHARTHVDACMHTRTHDVHMHTRPHQCWYAVAMNIQDIQCGPCQCTWFTCQRLIGRDGRLGARVHVRVETHTRVTATGRMHVTAVCVARGSSLTVLVLVHVHFQANSKLLEMTKKLTRAREILILRKLHASTHAHHITCIGRH